MGRAVQGGRGGERGEVGVSRGVDPGPGRPIKGSASAEASGAARCERFGLGCGRTSGPDLWSCCARSQQQNRRSGNGGWGVRGSCRGGGRRCSAGCLSGSPDPGKFAGCLGKSEKEEEEKKK